MKNKLYKADEMSRRAVLKGLAGSLLVVHAGCLLQALPAEWALLQKVSFKLRGDRLGLLVTP